MSIRRSLRGAVPTSPSFEQSEKRHMRQESYFWSNVRGIHPFHVERTLEHSTQVRQTGLTQNLLLRQPGDGRYTVCNQAIG